ncbi:hypothetical protein L9F63_011414, partial [Diploptera punctata]
FSLRRFQASLPYIRQLMRASPSQRGGQRAHLVRPPAPCIQPPERVFRNSMLKLLG